MYPQARWYIRSAFLYLPLAFLAAALPSLWPSPPAWLSAARPLFAHLLVVGWATQMICGMALWMFPPSSREHPRGNERLGWIAYGALNAGLLLRAIGEPFYGSGGAAWSGNLLAVSGILQMVAIWLLVWLLWPRIKGPAISRTRKES